MGVAQSQSQPSKNIVHKKKYDLAQEEANIMKNIDTLMKRRDTLTSSTTGTINFTDVPAINLTNEIPIHAGGAKFVSKQKRYTKYNVNIVDQHGGLNTEFANSTEMPTVDEQSQPSEPQPPQPPQPQPPQPPQQPISENSELSFSALKQHLENEIDIVAQMGGGYGSGTNNNTAQFGGEPHDESPEASPEASSNASSEASPKASSNASPEASPEASSNVSPKNNEYSLTATSVSSINLVPFYSTPESSFNNNVSHRKRFY